MSGTRLSIVLATLLSLASAITGAQTVEDSLAPILVAAAEESEVEIIPPHPPITVEAAPPSVAVAEAASLEAKPEASAEAKPEAPAEAKPEAPAEAKPEAPAEAKAEAKAETPKKPETAAPKPDVGDTPPRPAADAPRQSGGGGNPRPADGPEKAAAPPAEAPKGKSAPQNTNRPAAASKVKNIDQVQLQVFISEMSEQGLRDLGVNLSYTRFVRGVEQSGSLEEISTNLFNPPDRFESVALPTPQEGSALRPDKHNLAGLGLTGSVLNVGYGTIDFLFRGIERKADVDIISKPELLVENGQTASINAGGEIPYQAVAVKNAKEVLSVEWERIGVNLTVTPEILSNDMVLLNIKELTVKELSRFDKVRGLDLPVFSERTQMGNVMVPNGRTLVVGGLISEVVRRTERRVPVLGRLPIVGMGFRSRHSEADFTTLMVFVSPTIVDVRSPSREAESALEFWRQRETDWSNKARISEEFDDLQHQTGTGW